MSRRNFRKIHIGESVWEYKIGKQNVVIFSPEGIRYRTDHSKLTGLTWDSIERAHWKGSDIANLTPAIIRE